MKIRITDGETNVTVELSAEELIKMNNEGIDIGSLFGTGESSFNEDDYKDDDSFFDEEFKKDINEPVKADDLLKQEETKFPCCTNNDGGYLAEKTGFVKAWLEQHEIPYEKCDGNYTKYIKYELTASQLKELTDTLTKNGHIARGVFI